MKTIIMLVVFWSAFATTNARAEVGENIGQLMARYGEPENGLALMLGFGSWKRKQGEVVAMLEEGKAVIMAYTGGVDEETKKAFLERNLPSGQTWVKGDSVKSFIASHKASDPDPNELEQVELLQTADGGVWAVYNPKGKCLVVGTPEGFKKMASLAETGASGGF